MQAIQSRGTFNRAAFFEAVNLARKSRNLNWLQVSKECGVPTVTLSRLNTGKGLSVATVAALLAWAGLDARSFVNGGGVVVCSLCGEPGPGGSSHQSLIDCVMALRAHVVELSTEQVNGH